MFNFIFEGKLGEMLAPVVPANQLFLAIQHHKNDEIPQLMLSMDINNSQKLAEGGYSAIHCACRYNNRYALELLLSKGVSLELLDNAGNTPLHYAAKYGHVELCKILLERGSSLARRNKQNQNAYDAADSHVVRQYLLPLVFQAERSQTSDQQDLYAQMGVAQHVQQPVHHNPTPPPHIPLMNPYGASAGLPTTSTNPPPPPTYSVGGPPVALSTNGIVPTYSSHTSAIGGAQKAPGMARTFQPDGFHSSASDPELQRKYGHTRETLNIAPPPTDGAFLPGNAKPYTMPSSSSPYNMYSQQPPVQSLQPPVHQVPVQQPQFAPPPTFGAPPVAVTPQQSSVYSRYVPYDAHSNTAGPIPTQQLSHPPSLLSAATPASPVQPSISGTGSQRLLGNKSLPTGDLVDSGSPTAATPLVAHTINRQPPVMIFNPATDCGDVIDASSSSSSVL